MDNNFCRGMDNKLWRGTDKGNRNSMDRKAGRAMAKAAKRIVLVLVSIVVLFPLLWNLLSSLKSNAEIMASPWSLPARPRFDNYARAFQQARIGDYLLNSIVVTGAALALLAILSLTTSYALSRFASRISAAIRSLYMAGLFIKTPVILVPLFLSLSGLGLADSRATLAVVYAVGALPFSVYLLTGYMASVPRDYEESATIDGCGRYAILFKIVTPLVQPGLITVLIFNFFSFWNEYPIALTLIYSDAKKTLPSGVSNLYEVARYATDWGALFAALAIILVPTIAVYALTQKKLTSGVMVGGLKG
jgi:N-acetylglucosamine transport system permease protein